MGHPVFEAVRPFVGRQPEGCLVDYVGAHFLGLWNRLPSVPEIADGWTVPEPPVDEEYFEWIDLLQSIEAAGDSFTFVELGAGYGRWGIRAGVAARRKGVEDLRLVFVEGEPQHAAWLQEALVMNGLSDCSTLLEKAIDYGGEAVPFFVGHERRSMGFGTMIGWEAAEEDAGESYFGRPVSKSVSGYRQIMVESVTLETVLGGIGIVDLIDVDLQGAELELVRNSIRILNDQVRRVHIGTHRTDIEAELRARFQEAEWINVWDFACLQSNVTPYGTVDFQDGIQGWVNPRLSI